MIYSLIITKKDGDNPIVGELDTSFLDITFSDMANQSPVAMESRKLTIGTTDKQFHLLDFWSQIKDIDTQNIEEIAIYDNNNIKVFEILDPIENIFYLINFNGPGDLISFCYNKGGK